MPPGRLRINADLLDCCVRSGISLHAARSGSLDHVRTRRGGCKQQSGVRATAPDDNRRGRTCCTKLTGPNLKEDRHKKPSKALGPELESAERAQINEGSLGVRDDGRPKLRSPQSIEFLDRYREDAAEERQGEAFPLACLGAGFPGPLRGGLTR